MTAKIISDSQINPIDVVLFVVKLEKFLLIARLLIGFPFAITNHLGDAFFRGVAVC